MTKIKKAYKLNNALAKRGLTSNEFPTSVMQTIGFKYINALQKLKDART